MGAFFLTVFAVESLPQKSSSTLALPTTNCADSGNTTGTGTGAGWATWGPSLPLPLPAFPRAAVSPPLPRFASPLPCAGVGAGDGVATRCKNVHLLAHQ